MRQPTSDLRIRTARPLLSPAILEEDLPLPEAGAAHGNFRSWQGELYFVAFYDVALSADEVKTLAALPYAAR